MNGWFPRLRADGVIASGNTSIWLTDLDGVSREVAAVGGSPVWAAQTLVYNLRDGRTQAGSVVLPIEYSEYAGSDVGQFAGAVQDAVGRVDRYGIDTANTTALVMLETIPAACYPRFCGKAFGYLMPYQADAQGHIRTLIVSDIIRHTDTIIDWCANPGGGCYLYTVARGTYARRIFDQRGNDVTIRAQQDETPHAVFIRDGLPWMASWTPTHTFVRMIYSAQGYVWEGDFLNADCRMIGSRAHLVGSTSQGQLREAWIDFNQPMVDLREV